MLKAVFVVLLMTGQVAAKPQLTLSQSPPKAPGPNSALCNPCVQLSGQSLQILINYILNVGVIGGCGKLCSHLNSTAAQKACDLVCGAVGIKEFIKALSNTDLDPFYFCEVVHACAPGPDDAAVELVGVQMNPATLSKKDILPGQPGVTVEGVLTVNVTKHSGVGQFGVSVHGPVTGTQGPPGGSFILADGLKEGVQNLGVKLNIQDTMPDPSGQQPFPVSWEPGSYEFRFHVCQGECGSKHPHSIDFGHKASNFTITESLDISV